MEKQVVFPAPFGPKRPTASPRLTEDLHPRQLCDGYRIYVSFQLLGPSLNQPLSSEEYCHTIPTLLLKG